MKRKYDVPNPQPSLDSPSRVSDELDWQERAVRQGTVHDSESRATIVWNCFDNQEDVDISVRNRPHWDQNGAVTFVTMRLADSMPKPVVERWLNEQRDWLARHGFANRCLESALHRNDIPRDIRRAFTKFKNQRWHEHLDACLGSCVLRVPKYASMVADSLLQFDGDRYDMERFVVMPNHAHLLVQMRRGWALRKQCESWMRYSGRQIHADMACSAEFWSEPFDHIVRNADQFEYLRQYIVDNPSKAKLATGEYRLWVRPVGFVTVDAIRSSQGSLLSHDSSSRDS
jgi:type I restriction enzyme R subunit